MIVMQFTRPVKKARGRNMLEMERNYLDTGMDNSLIPRLRTGNVPAIERLVKLALLFG